MFHNSQNMRVQQEIQLLKQKFMTDPDFRKQLFASNPDLEKLLRENKDNELRKYISDKLKVQFEANRKEQERKMRLMNADPNDAEAQKQIEEEIRKNMIEANMSNAMEEHPEFFAQVTMLYVDVKVNGNPVQAFVDSGAQCTIIS